MKTCIDFYDDTAQSWADRWYPDEVNIPYLKRLIELTKIKKPRILDLCCGAGYESMRLRNLGAEVVGADLSEKSLQIAKKMNPEIEFYKQDMLKSYKVLGMFDAIACIAGIVHIEKDKLSKVFENMHQVLNKNGLLFLVFKSNGENRYTATYNDQEYARNFIFHSVSEVTEASANHFKIIENLGENEDWQYLILKKI